MPWESLPGLSDSSYKEVEAEKWQENASNWHSSAILPQIHICYNWYSEKFAMQPLRYGKRLFCRKGGGIILSVRIRKLLKSERAEANYFSTVVFIFIAVLMLAFIIDIFSIISTKQELDHCVDQMVKQIQLSGGVNGETESLFRFLSSEMEGAENISYSIDTSGSASRIQLGDPFYVTITGKTRLGGFWNFNLVHITVVARGAGVSEHYWK